MTADPDRLLDGIEARAAMSTWLDDETMAEEVIRAQWARTTLLERLRAVADRIDVTLAGQHVIRGHLDDWTADAIVLRDDRAARWLIPVQHIVRLSDLGSATVPDDSVGEVRRSRRLTAILRGWSDEGARVTAYLVEGSVLDGVIVRVGADHVDVSINAGRRRETVPIAVISAVRST